MTRPTLSDLTTAALAAAARGWHVYPMVPGQKFPALHGADACPATGICAATHQGWEQRATIDPDRIKACWSTRLLNVGIATGPSGLVVIDLDKPKPGEVLPRPDVADGAGMLGALVADNGLDLPDTFTVATTSGGTHLYYAHPTTGPRLGSTKGSLGWKIDTRAHGGAVVAAGSIVNGRVYEITRDLPVAPLPGWLADLLAPKPLPPQRPLKLDLPTDRRGKYLRAAIDRQLAEITAAAKGTRNGALYVSAVALGQLVAGGALPDADTRELLARTALDAGLRPREVERTISSGFRAGAQRPRTVNA